MTGGGGNGTRFRLLCETQHRVGIPNSKKKQPAPLGGGTAAAHRVQNGGGWGWFDGWRMAGAPHLKRPPPLSAHVWLLAQAAVLAHMDFAEALLCILIAGASSFSHVHVSYPLKRRKNRCSNITSKDTNPETQRTSEVLFWTWGRGGVGPTHLPTPNPLGMAVQEGQVWGRPPPPTTDFHRFF